MLVNSFKLNNLQSSSVFKNSGQNGTAFTSCPEFLVKKPNYLKLSIAGLSFVSSIVCSAGYFVGGTGLFYDCYADSKNKKSKQEFLKNPPKDLSNAKYFIFPKGIKQDEKGVKTIIPTTKFGQAAVYGARTAVFASSTSGLACGISEGIPLMALGEATGMGAAKNIETPSGTGLFAVGLASTFAGLALDNTPYLKLNEFDMMAEKSFAKKAKMVLNNIKVCIKELGVSLFDIAKNIYKPKFFKENILQGTPKFVTFKEAVNKDGKVFVTKELRHSRNYVMNAASLVLALGGTSLTLSSLFGAKKVQKASLKVEESGFFVDNFGTTRYGLDKFTTGQKGTGFAFILGGLMNAVSQFIGLDNKDGRALQWLGVAPVFVGFSIDRGKMLVSGLKHMKTRPELTRVIREWKFDLTNLVENSKELKALQKEIKAGKDVTNVKFIEFENRLKDVLGEHFQSTDEVKQKLADKFSDSPNFAQEIKAFDYKNIEEAKEVLSICTKKIFGENPAEA